MSRFLLLVTIGCLVMVSFGADSDIDIDQSSSFESTEIDQYPQINSTLLQKLRVRRQSYNSGNCQIDRVYCGDELRNLGYTNTNDNILYRCERNYEGSYLATCGNGCHRNNGASHCHCQARGTYCGYQLKKMNFPFAIEEHELHQCTEMHQISRYQSCDMGCQSNGHASARCASSPPNQCNLGQQYCGYELSALGYDDAQAQAIYQCRQKTGYVPPLSVSRGKWPKVIVTEPVLPGLQCRDNTPCYIPPPPRRIVEPRSFDNIGAYLHDCASGCHRDSIGRSYCGSGYVAKRHQERYYDSGCSTCNQYYDKK